MMDYKDSSGSDDNNIRDNITVKKPSNNPSKTNIGKGSIFLKKRDLKINLEEKPKIEM